MPTTSNSTLYIVKNPNDRKRTPPNVIIKEQDQQQQQQTENEIKTHAETKQHAARDLSVNARRTRAAYRPAER